MSHMVIFRSDEGKVGYHQAETQEEAARFVERLRNHEGVEQARIFRLEEVGFEFRPYFRVEIGSSGEATAPRAEDAESHGEVASVAAEEPLEQPEANGKRRFSSMGRL